VKLLFDANVSHKLVQRLASEYPGSTHVRQPERTDGRVKVLDLS
jgi:hypothetical protein